MFPLGDSNKETTIHYTMALGATGPESPETGSLGGPSISLWGKSCLDIEPCVKNCSQTPTNQCWTIKPSLFSHLQLSNYEYYLLIMMIKLFKQS